MDCLYKYNTEKLIWHSTFGISHCSEAAKNVTKMHSLTHRSNRRVSSDYPAKQPAVCWGLVSKRDESASNAFSSSQGECAPGPPVPQFSGSPYYWETLEVNFNLKIQNEWR